MSETYPRTAADAAAEARQHVRARLVRDESTVSVARTDNRTYLGLSLPWVSRTHRQSLRGWYRYCRRDADMTVDQARRDCWEMFYRWSRAS